MLSRLERQGNLCEDRPVQPPNLTGPMTKLGLVCVLALTAAACTTTEQRVSGAAAGAGAGAIVAGPIGAVVGGAAGAVYAPTVNRSARRALR